MIAIAGALVARSAFGGRHDEPEMGVSGEPVDEGHFRDTILVMPGDEIDVGLVATDKGTWIVRCHIQEHAEAGMITLLEVS